MKGGKMKATKIFASLFVFVILCSTAMAISVYREFPTQVSPGESFTIKYQTQNAPNDNYFITIEDEINGGCTPDKKNVYILEESGGDTFRTAQFTAPSSGSCIFTGSYNVASEGQKTLTANTVQISGTAPTGDSELPIALIIGIIVVIVAIVILKK